MSDSKIFFTFIGLFIAIFAVYNTSFRKSINESFIPGGGMVAKVMREVVPGKGSNMKAYSIPIDYNQALSGNLKFVQRPNFQSNLAPRFSTQNYGPNIKYSMPNYKNQAVPHDPMALGDMAKEGYTAGCSTRNTNANKFGDSSYNSNISSLNKIVAPANYLSDMLPVGDMSQINPDGSVQNQIVYDRYIYANQKSYLRSQGDMIRGDLPIIPQAKNGWFNVSATPHIDLQKGALNVMAGENNTTTKELAALMAVSSGNTQNFDAALDMSNKYNMTGSGTMSRDVKVTSFI